MCRRLRDLLDTVNDVIYGFMWAVVEGLGEDLDRKTEK